MRSIRTRTTSRASRTSGAAKAAAAALTAGALALTLTACGGGDGKDKSGKPHEPSPSPDHAETREHLADVGRAFKVGRHGHRPADVVIVAAVRSAITKGHKGGFKDTRPEEYLSGILSAVWKKAGIDPTLIEDITVGNVLPPGGGALTARMAALAAGIPESVPISTVNRQCSSGLQAVNTIAAEIASGQIDIGIGEFVA